MFPSPEKRGYRQLGISRFPSSDKTTSMIGLCQEGKSSPDALRRARGVNAFPILRHVCGLSAAVPTFGRTRLPFAVRDPRVVFDRRLSWCFPASLETYQREHPEVALLRPVVLPARPGRRFAEESSWCATLRYAAARVSLSTIKKPFSRRSTATK